MVSAESTTEAGTLGAGGYRWTNAEGGHRRWSNRVVRGRCQGEGGLQRDPTEGAGGGGGKWRRPVRTPIDTSLYASTHSLAVTEESG